MLSAQFMMAATGKPREILNFPPDVPPLPRKRRRNDYQSYRNYYKIKIITMTEIEVFGLKVKLFFLTNKMMFTNLGKLYTKLKPTIYILLKK